MRLFSHAILAALIGLSASLAVSAPAAAQL